MTTATADKTISDRIAALRTQMARYNLSAYVVPSPDPHQSEYVPLPWQRRAWISNFTGSMGTAAVTKDKAFVWTDSRYWLQAEKEVDGTVYTLMRHGEPDVPDVAEWIEKTFTRGERIGIDPEVITLKTWRDWESRCKRTGAVLVAVEGNLIDPIWKGRPPMPKGEVISLPESFAGQSAADKIKALREKMEPAHVDAHAITMLDSVMWLFNIRGDDMTHNPVSICYAIVTDVEAQLFIDSTKLSSGAKSALAKSGVTVLPYTDFVGQIDDLAMREAKVWVDPGTVSYHVFSRLVQDGNGADVYEADSPIVLAKAIKNPVELAGMRACHTRDGAAVVKLFRWLEDGLKAGKRITECETADQLLKFRQMGEKFRGASFSTISGYGANGAIVHYFPQPATCAVIKPDNLFLLDSGGQYMDGTTDITRTVTLGNITAEQKTRYTLVLKGHIGVATARFPQGTLGSQLDTLARKPLWDAGLNYGHGTGHGVGHFLCVHEGPQGIAPRSTTTALRVGMILSNEPGYYKTGGYGIRIENLVEVIDAEQGPDGIKYMQFADLTMCPIDIRCVDASLLDAGEKKWLNAYHVKVRTALTPFLADAADKAYLDRATQPV